MMIISAIFKFCTDKRLFTYFKNRLNGPQVSVLNNIVALKGKLRNQLIQLKFLEECLNNKVVPGHIQARLLRSKVKPSFTIEQAFLRDEIAIVVEKFSRLRNMLREVWREARVFLGTCDTIRLCNLLARQDDRLLAKGYKK